MIFSLTQFKIESRVINFQTEKLLTFALSALAVLHIKLIEMMSELKQIIKLRLSLRY
jgi:hypothetical protein